MDLVMAKEIFDDDPDDLIGPTKPKRSGRADVLGDMLGNNATNRSRLAYLKAHYDCLDSFCTALEKMRDGFSRRLPDEIHSFENQYIAFFDYMEHLHASIVNAGKGVEAEKMIPIFASATNRMHGFLKILDNPELLKPDADLSELRTAMQEAISTSYEQETSDLFKNAMARAPVKINANRAQMH